MSWIADVVIVIILLGALTSGLRSGFAATLGALLGLVAGAAAALWVLPRIAVAVDPPWRTPSILGALIVLLLLGCFIGARLGGLVRRGADRLHMRIPERLLGGALGLVVALLAVSIGGTSLASAGIPGLSPAVASSRVLGAVERATPDPVDEALARARSAVLGGIPMPAITVPPQGLATTDAATSPPVDLEDPALSRAARSVARVSGPARGCGTISTGSGFVIAPDRILTNAHVVAGLTSPMVELPGERASEGRVVYFDPADDLAVIAADVDAKPLHLADTLAPGASAAIQGYPHGGPFRSQSATVRARGAARMHDATRAKTVQRNIYVLDADVVPGNSGGPLLTKHGGVAGIVFARAEHDDRTAYAMTNAELLPVIAQLHGDHRTVSTGSCRS